MCTVLVLTDLEAEAGRVKPVQRSRKPQRASLPGCEFRLGNQSPDAIGLTLSLWFPTMHSPCEFNVPTHQGISDSTGKECHFQVKNLKSSRQRVMCESHSC